MNLIKILSIVLLIASLGLAAYLGINIKSTIDDRDMITDRENAVIQKLKLIRESEKLYLEVNGNYTSDWNKLINFIQNGQVPIVEKKETIITLSYGADSVHVDYDTLGVVPAKDRIFKENFNVNAANDGIFKEFKVKEGDEGLQGTVAYTINQGGKDVDHKFKRSGIVMNLSDIFPGSQVSKGDLLMTLQEQKFKESTFNLAELSKVPGYTDVNFDIYANEVQKGNVTVDVIEVRNPRPFDPTRSEENDASNRRPLRFGSRTDVTTSGNWE